MRRLEGISGVRVCESASRLGVEGTESALDRRKPGALKELASVNCCRDRLSNWSIHLASPSYTYTRALSFRVRHFLASLHGSEATRCDHGDVCMLSYRAL